MLRLGGFYRNRAGRVRYARPLLSDDPFKIAFERQPNRAQRSWSDSPKRQGARAGSSCEDACEKTPLPNQMTRTVGKHFIDMSGGQESHIAPHHRK